MNFLKPGFKAFSLGLLVAAMIGFGMVSTVSAQQQTAAPAAKQNSDGFTWTPWLSAGDKIWKAVIRIEPKLKDIIGDGRQVAVATIDLEYNGLNEIVLYFWGADDCGVDGCLYVILGNNGQYKRAFVARSLKRSGQGINVDGRYYKL